jgi:lipopolysaccharide transport system ATP-binding protein
MPPIITVENLSKKYNLCHHREKYITLRDVIARKAERVWRNIKALTRAEDSFLSPENPCREEFWALKDISFEVNPGDRVGIIGRNGAGKSTLLKILSRITEPTTGRVTLRGRVASLLEVGTGFHPELTGRENIYLNGAILGMTRLEIKRKFDEIVAFAEVEKFLDTPVKHYSSGMYVRLAFAVAAHLESEILLVDEVLAVGDAQFQKKCLGKMEAVATQQGRTVLFVSHNMGAIKQLCTECILLNKGKIVLVGQNANVIESYLNEQTNTADLVDKRLEIDENKDFQVLEVQLLNSEGINKTNFNCDTPVIIQMKCISRKSIKGLYGCLTVMNREGVIILTSDSFDFPPNALDSITPGEYAVRIEIPPRTLAHGDYRVSLNYTSSQSEKNFWVDRHECLCAFHLDDISTDRGNNRSGFFSTLLKWDLNRL